MTGTIVPTMNASLGDAFSMVLFVSNSAATPAPLFVDVPFNFPFLGYTTVYKEPYPRVLVKWTRGQSGFGSIQQIMDFSGYL